MDASSTAASLTSKKTREQSEPSTREQHFYSERVRVAGKFLALGSEKFWVRGASYGTFRQIEKGEQFPPPDVASSDFQAMSAAGINTIRTYTPPPLWLLDLAQHHGLRVMVGLAWEQHVTFLDDRKLRKNIEQRVREGIRACQRHPAILCYLVGNEIPASIVRWHGRRKVENFIKRLYLIAKSEDSETLVSYANYPTTEYLQLKFLDFLCFNLYLESAEAFKNYLARLHNLAGNKPLLMSEIGLDSRRNGEQQQAEHLRGQIESAFSCGCAGTVVFAWTDEWFRGDVEILDWDFGLCNRDRMPKPSLKAVHETYQRTPFAGNIRWPRISVVVCSCNGARTIRDTLDALTMLEYPDYEVVVIDDGSTDMTAAIVAEYPVSLMKTSNRGLGNARNSGWNMATGEIVAYIDDDAFPDPHWLYFLAHTYLTTDYVAVGGLSPAPEGGGFIADCVANAPGRPVHVLLSDTEAEHIPGCNMSFRREALEAIGGFDPRFRQAGDDVDICWRILDEGWKIGYHASAITWHHCRNSVSEYWKQQRGYGKAEALLEDKWPKKYNLAGQITWQGKIYSNAQPELIASGRGRIYQGQWGSAPFQSLHGVSTPMWSSIASLPEWFLVVGLLGCLSALGIAWPPLLLAAPLLVLSMAILLVQAVASARIAQSPTPRPKRWQQFLLKTITAFLFLIQPLARLNGRIQHGLTPWRQRVGNGASTGWRLRRRFSLWSERWLPHDEWLTALERSLLADSIPLVQGGEFDRWDMEIRSGLFGRTRLLTALEEHGGGKQFLRIDVRPQMYFWAIMAVAVSFVLGLLAWSDGSVFVAGALTGGALLISYRFRHEALKAAAAVKQAFHHLEQMSQDQCPVQGNGMESNRTR